MPIRLLKLLTVIVLLLLPAIGHTQELKDLIAGLGEPDPKPAIEALATNDDPKAKARPAEFASPEKSASSRSV